MVVVAIVVVAQHRVDAVGRRESRELVHEGRQFAPLPVDQVAGKDDEVGVQAVDAVHPLGQIAAGRAQRLDMQVGELDDAIAVEALGEAVEGDGAFVINRVLPGVECAVEHAGCDEEGECGAGNMSPSAAGLVPQAGQVVEKGEYRVEPFGHVNEEEGVECPHGYVDVDGSPELDLEEYGQKYGHEHHSRETPPTCFQPPGRMAQVAPEQIDVGQQGQKRK